MRTLAIILGRGGSKGVPGKNMREIAGRPCAAWTVDHALRAALVSRVIVSTDCPRLSTLALSMGVDVVARPAALASDTATVDDAARHALGEVGEDFGCVVILYANVPVRPDGLVDRAIELLSRTGCDSVQSYAPVGKHHPWWTARVDDDGHVRPWEGDVLNHGVYRRQDLPAAFIPDGGVIAVTARALRMEIGGVGAGPHAFFGKDRRGVVNPEGSVIDIDSEVDLRVADSVLMERAHA
ncbi:MAG: acylneuraminate cytidylyltransferase family protein [Phycisphaerales bacterium]|nr:acylneuraminate cytidylyltransferase family protein [Phycisphaerales bacterium]